MTDPVCPTCGQTYFLVQHPEWCINDDRWAAMEELELAGE